MPAGIASEWVAYEVTHSLALRAGIYTLWALRDFESDFHQFREFRWQLEPTGHMAEDLQAIEGLQQVVDLRLQSIILGREHYGVRVERDRLNPRWLGTRQVLPLSGELDDEHNVLLGKQAAGAIEGALIAGDADRGGGRGWAWGYRTRQVRPTR